jgi:hypothetical protein
LSTNAFAYPLGSDPSAAHCYRSLQLARQPACMAYWHRLPYPWQEFHYCSCIKPGDIGVTCDRAWEVRPTKHDLLAMPYLRSGPQKRISYICLLAFLRDSLPLSSLLFSSFCFSLLHQRLAFDFQKPILLYVDGCRERHESESF